MPSPQFIHHLVSQHQSEALAIASKQNNSTKAQAAKSPKPAKNTQSAPFPPSNPPSPESAIHFSPIQNFQSSPVTSIPEHNQRPTQPNPFQTEVNPFQPIANLFITPNPFSMKQNQGQKKNGNCDIPEHEFMEVEIQKLKMQLQQVTAENSTLKKQVKHLEKEKTKDQMSLGNLRALYNIKDQQIASLTQQFQEQTRQKMTETKQFQSQIQSLTQKLESQKALNQKQAADMSRLEVQLKQTRSPKFDKKYVQELERKNEIYRTQITQLQALHQQDLQEMDSPEEDEEYIEELERKNEIYKAQIAQLQTLHQQDLQTLRRLGFK